jgi:hypothetical protein
MTLMPDRFHDQDRHRSGGIDGVETEIDKHPR